VHNPHPDLAANETHVGNFLSNARGTFGIGHGLGASGNSDVYINLEDNSHLDTMSYGFCVCAEVVDSGSFEVIDALAIEVRKGEMPVIQRALVKSVAQ